MNSRDIRRILAVMKVLRPSLAAAAAVLLLATCAQAACRVEYKAVRDNPFDLTYGVMQVQASPCTRASVRARV